MHEHTDPLPFALEGWREKGTEGEGGERGRKERENGEREGERGGKEGGNGGGRGER